MYMLRDFVLKYRAEHNMTVVQFADKIGVTAPTIQKIESGETPSRLVIAKVANLLGVDYSELVREER